MRVCCLLSFCEGCRRNVAMCRHTLLSGAAKGLESLDQLHATDGVASAEKRW